MVQSQCRWFCWFFNCQCAFSAKLSEEREYLAFFQVFFFHLFHCNFDLANHFECSFNIDGTFCSFVLLRIISTWLENKCTQYRKYILKNIELNFFWQIFDQSKEFHFWHFHSFCTHQLASLNVDEEVVVLVVSPLMDCEQNLESILNHVRRTAIPQFDGWG